MYKYALLYLAALLIFAYGFLVADREIFPYELLRSVKDEIKFVKNDLLGDVRRFLVSYDSSADENHEALDSQAFADNGSPLVFARSPEPGYRVVYGAFDFNPPAHAAVLLGPDHQVAHIWRLNEDALAADASLDVRNDANKFPHGMEVLADGSIIFSYDGGASIQRFDVCSEPLWSTPGNFHHALSIDADDNYLWAMLDGHKEAEELEDKASWRYIVRLDKKTGEIVKRISLRQIMDANPDIDILGLHQTDYDDRFEWQDDSFHGNDVEALPQDMAAAFPQFEAGDLLLSFRSLNLVTVVDPDTLKVKWWRIAQTRRQHDPDWQPNGQITVYDNNMHRGNLRVLSLAPDTFNSTVLYDGNKHAAKSWFRGKHQVLPNGNILVTVPQQGRVLEVTEDSELVFEFLNRYHPEPGHNLVVSEARWLPLDYFEFEEFPDCAN